jgi:anthranilate phosphoribosyltransferase
VAFAQTLGAIALKVDHQVPKVVDTCGTGGGKPTFNISTAAAFVAAGAGATVAKHGNRSSTGLGSADLLEALGVSLTSNAETLSQQLMDIGIAFLFAPNHHPAMRHVAAARRKLGRRSFFNLLGPLVNPAGATRLSIGIYDFNLVPTVSEAVAQLNLEKAVLSHSEDGLDEISPCAETKAVFLENGILSHRVLCPEEFGVNRLEWSQIEAGSNLEDSKNMFLEAISEPSSARANAVIPSAAVAIWLADLDGNLADAADRARVSIREGQALHKLQQLVGNET